MAQIESRGSGRTINTELNLVPFIDLMSVLITFLLITAVWSQVSMIQLGSSIHAQKTDDREPPPPSPLADIAMRLDVKATGYRLIVGAERTEFAKKNGAYDTLALTEKLQQVKKKYPEKIDTVITVADELQYESLVTGMDVLLQQGFAQITINPAEAE